MNIRETGRGFGHKHVRARSSLQSITVLSIATLLAACASVMDIYRDNAKRNHWTESLIDTSQFVHRVWYKPGKLPSQPANRRDNTLHVYIEGDGQAWLTSTTPSRDPTPNDGLMFRLMAKDDSRSVYIGRPCYFDTHDDHCDVRWWTFQRYHPDIVTSMVSTIETVVKQQCAEQPCDPPRITLIGHSGGGTLSVLAASHLQHVQAVMTVAGNLDTDAWIKAHGYLPLAGSLNPATEPALPGSIRQIHLIAERDDIIPSGVIASYCKNQPPSVDIACVSVPDTTHNSGWVHAWPSLLATYASEADQP